MYFYHGVGSDDRPQSNMLIVLIIVPGPDSSTKNSCTIYMKLLLK